MIKLYIQGLTKPRSKGWKGGGRRVGVGPARCAGVSLSGLSKVRVG